MSCRTLEEIGEQEGLTKEAVSLICQEMVKLPELDKLLADHKTDYERPLYNVWKFKNKTNEVSHFGNPEVTILDNLLAKYTKPFDVVVDPFAGGGPISDGFTGELLNDGNGQNRCVNIEPNSLVGRPPSQENHF